MKKRQKVSSPLSPSQQRWLFCAEESHIITTAVFSNFDHSTKKEKQVVSQMRTHGLSAERERRIQINA